jgi:hypothetical protein
MVHNTPSIVEEDENNDHDRVQFVVDKRTETSLVTNQHEQLPPITCEFIK